MVNPRSVIVTVRLTPEEIETLTFWHGSAGKGLRALVDDWKHRDDVKITMEGPSAPKIITGVAGHRHRRGAELDPLYDMGTKKRRWMCAEPGCDKVLS